MAWVHWTERQRTSSILSTINEHNATVGQDLQIRLAGTNDDEHIITSSGRKRLQSHPYYRQIVDRKDDTYWEVYEEEDHTPREVKKLKLQKMLNTDPSSSKRPHTQVVPFTPCEKPKRARASLASDDEDEPYARITHVAGVVGQPLFFADANVNDNIPMVVAVPVEAPPAPQAVPAPPEEAPPAPQEAPPVSSGVKELVALFHAMQNTFNQIIEAKNEIITAKNQTIQALEKMIPH